MVENPAVTVIIATYNSSGTLRFALASLLNQRFQNFEAWIVGDSCTDDSESVVRGFGDARLNWINLDRNHGSQAFPNNEGLRRAKGRYIAYLGHDDLWLPHHLETLVELIETTNAALAHSLCPTLNCNGVYMCFGPPRGNHGYARHFVPPSCWLHRRNVTDETGFWNDPAKLAWPVDFDFLRRVALKKLPIVCARRVTLLKFPSADFRLYARESVPPQAEYWQAIGNDPVRVEMEMQSCVGSLPSMQPEGSSTAPERFVRSMRYAAGSLKYVWPFCAVWRYRFQHERRAQRVRRGLGGGRPASPPT